MLQYYHGRISAGGAGGGTSGVLATAAEGVDAACTRPLEGARAGVCERRGPVLVPAPAPAPGVSTRRARGLVGDPPLARDRDISTQ